LWNVEQDIDWIESGGGGWNPFIWTTPFNDYFARYDGLNGLDMMTLIDHGGGPDDFRKAARDLVAAYLNASWGMRYPYTTDQLADMWAETVASGNFLSLHVQLDAANNSYQNGAGNCPISAKNEDLNYEIFLPVISQSVN